MSSGNHKPAIWFWVVAGLFLLWDIAGIFAFYVHVGVDTAALAAMTAYDRQAYLALPSWYNWVFALAVWPALLGSVALLARSKFARPLFIASLIGVIVQFGWVFGATDLIAVKGVLATVPFPIFIFVLAVAQVWFAGIATKRGWLR
ncbi:MULTISPECIES: hypothetical protein [unclassified Sphingomonas]|uniref:hypothetical protein n=1 Tax=unclassified Sphingomonas TaxID=196159 RepID=UPI000BD47DA9|nr:MAG: hypothetical protein B7Z43_04125 [Sphingomonas sp. 12-62-6]OYX40195.1 MAG: hypothetical protein B7Y98_02285 [Sphingomonas sp. 32-62-10]OYY64347.1 MAG: hypothetical protein B7Y49_10230 [Sphingomonas sp. 28-62-11]